MNNKQDQNYDYVKFNKKKRNPQSVFVQIMKVLLILFLIGVAIAILLVAACFGMLGGFR